MAPMKALVVDVCDLTGGERREMLHLMERYFEGVQPPRFERDLREKQWVLLCRDVSGRVVAFSTLCVIEECVGGVGIRAFYSGDTIVDRAHWGSLSYAREWIRFVFAVIDRSAGHRWYWFLVCKGYRTYRYMPVYFLRYLPSPLPPPAFDRLVLGALARNRFGSRYEEGSGIVRCPEDYRLRSGVGDIGVRERANPVVAFYEQRNPEWAAGAELACLAELRRENLRPAALRLLGAGEAPCV